MLRTRAIDAKVLAARCQSLGTSENPSCRRSPPTANYLMLKNEDDLSAKRYDSAQHVLLLNHVHNRFNRNHLLQMIQSHHPNVSPLRKKIL